MKEENRALTLLLVVIFSSVLFVFASAIYSSTLPGIVEVAENRQASLDVGSSTHVLYGLISQEYVLEILFVILLIIVVIYLVLKHAGFFSPK